jgi:hypothetical protein
MDMAELKVESNWDNEGKKCYPVRSAPYSESMKLPSWDSLFIALGTF